jgi:myxalamid-type polyketide synthase MxaB
MRTISDQAAPPISPKTLVELLRDRAERQPDQRAYTFLADGQTESGSLTYGEVDRHARLIGGRLQALGAAGERVLVLCPPGLEYIVAFFGCLYAGAVAVPAYPPEPSRLNRTLPRLQTIMSDARASIALTTTPMLPVMQPLFVEVAGPQKLDWLAIDLAETDTEQESGWQHPTLSTADLAFLMYTSGSTGAPKGVMVSHGNALHNAAAFPGFVERPCHAVVSWLPLFHDLGLFLAVIHPLYRGVPGIFMPPAAFVQHPFRWLQAISSYGATITGGPNFAYDLCVRKTTPEQRATLDLSHWNLALNGAEPVRAETLHRFVETFGPCGFQPEALYPSYGLSDATATVSGAIRFVPPSIHILEREALKRGEVVETTVADEATSTFVGCGVTVPGQRIAIVDPATLCECAPKQIGEIWVSGPSIAQGYWGRPEDSERVFGACLADSGEGPFLRTGDLGCLIDGELIITGRLKDLIVIRGQNHYPEDLEYSIERSHPALRLGCGAAFSIEVDGEEQLAIIHEVDQHADLDSVIPALCQTVIERHDVQAYAVALIGAGSIPKTSSGKIARSACRDAYLSGSLPILKTWRRDQADQRPSAAEAADHGATGERSLAYAEVRGWLLARFAKRLGLTPDRIDAAQPFTRYGLDSADALSLVGELEDWLGRRLSQTLAWDYPNIDALAAHLSSTQPSPALDLQPTIRADEAIAIVGMGCRFPGASSPEAFWQLLRDGVDAITEIPANRWSADDLYDADSTQPGKMTTRWGGFVESIDQFDAEFFGISPREAVHIDPQQRLLLEVTWEALENAGIAPTGLGNSRTGVFIGICNSDHARRELWDHQRIGPYSGTGTSYSIAANRLSYTLDLRGPSMAIDTACSSSLVAIHLACQSLRSGESSLALAGGVNLILSPEISMAFSKARMMAADGRCKTYDDEANGYVRAEGCGVVVLKRLSEAQADGDTILAVVRGSAINQDGRSNGITAPNGIAQQAVIRQALSNAGITPSDLDYIEAHGTGTPLGDVIEMQALSAVLSSARTDDTQPLVGSVKTNIGHLEAAAGVAGLIKVILSLRHGEIPPHLHLRQINRRLTQETTALKIPTERQSWRSGTKPRLAGISSFGFGGTNAHLVIEEAPPQPEEISAEQRPLHALSLSAQSATALRTLAASFEAHLADHPDLRLGDVCFTANTGRTHFDQRLVAIVESVDDLRSELRAFAGGEEARGIVSGALESQKRPKVAWMFTGQGAQYAGMAQQLYATQPLFRSVLDSCSELLRPHLDGSLLDYIYPAADVPSRLDETWLTQPALFAVEYALAQLWLSWGIQPDAVLGHSVGEYVAACVAGVFSLEDGLKLIADRARLMNTLPPGGGMVTVMAAESKIRPLIEPYSDQINVAAYNGPALVVLSGVQQVLEELIQQLDAAEIDYQRLKVSHAFHSVLMEPMLTEFMELARTIQTAPPRIPLVSNLTGRFLEADQIGPEYWAQHLRAPVRFKDSIEFLAGQEFTIFLELGPKASLCSMVRRITPPKTGVVALPSLVGQSKAEDWSVLLRSLAQLHVRAVPIDWQAFDHGYGWRKVALPTYPFDRRPCWYDEPAAALPAQATGSAIVPRLHPLVDHEVVAPALQSVVFQKRLTLAQDVVVRDHHVHGLAMLPGVAFLEMALVAAQQQPGKPVQRLTDIALIAPVGVEANAETVVQVVLETPADHLERLSFQVVSLAADRSWTKHVTGSVLRSSTAEHQRGSRDLNALRARCPRELTPEALYAAFAQTGIQYGPYFQPIASVRMNDHEVLSELRLPEAAQRETGYVLHPSLLDGSLQTLGALFVTSDSKTFIPFAIEEVEIYSALPQRIYVHAERVASAAGADLLRGNVTIVDEHGQELIALRNIHLKRLRSQQPSAAITAELPSSTITPAQVGHWFHQYQWQSAPRGSQQPWQTRTWLVFMDELGLGDALRPRIEANGDRWIGVYSGAAFEDGGARGFTINRNEPRDYRALVDALREQGIVPTGILHLWTCTPAPSEPLSLEALEDGQAVGVYSLLYITQALMERSSHPLLYCVATSYSQSLEAAFERPIAPEKATLWGLSRVVPLEYPQITCLGLDLETSATPVEHLAQLVLDELAAATTSAWVAYHQGERFQADLVPLDRLIQPQPLFREGGVYLITGGQSGIGLEIARLIARAVRARLVLINRTLPDEKRQPERVAGLRELEALGSEVMPIGCDVTDLTAMQQVIDQIALRWGRLDGVIHSAGVLSDGMIWNIDRAHFEKVLRPKVHGAWTLAQVTQPYDLDFFVLCSSMAALRPAPGQSNHVAANSFEDAFAHYTSQALGRRMIAINWGLWGETGVVASPQYLKALEAKGIYAFTNAEGMAGLVGALSSGLSQIAFFKPDRQPSVPEIEGGVRLERIPAQVAPQIARLKAELHLDSYTPLTAQLDVVSLGYILAAFRALGWQPELHQRCSTEALRHQLGIVPQHEMLFGRLLYHLEQAGVLRAVAGGWELCQVPQLDDPNQQMRTLIERYPAFGAELTLLERCGPGLAEILHGDLEPLRLLFPEGSLSNSDAIYQHSVFSQFYQTVAQHAVEAVIAQLPQDRAIRVLEVGAGTGGTTSYVLKAFPADRTSYVFTDMSSLFLSKAQAKFAAYPFVQYQRLNIEHDPEAQGFAAHTYDLVIAANVIHATRDLRQTLGHIRQLLASDGILILLELARPQRWLDLTFGLTDGWWRFATSDHDPRETYPLLAPDQWQALLQEIGWKKAIHVPPMSTSANQPAAQAVVIGQAPEGVTQPDAARPSARPLEQTMTQVPAPAAQAPAAGATSTLRQTIQQVIIDQVVRSLQLADRRIPLDKSFHALGLDSLLAVEITSALKERLKISLSPTLLFEYPSIAELSEYLVKHHSPTLRQQFDQVTAAPEARNVSAVPSPVAAPPHHEPALNQAAAAPLPSSAAPAPQRTAPVTAPGAGSPIPQPVQAATAPQPVPTEDIAIIGMACRFPGAPDLDAFWRLLSNGQDAVSEVPAERWNWRTHFAETPGVEGKTYSRWGGYIDQIDQFDARFFNISAKEAPYIDPQQRLILETAWQTLEHAGYAGDRLANTDTGVFIGCSYNHYFQLQQRQAPQEALTYFAALGNSNAILSNRVSFFFNFQGPSLVIDTLCSSSLVALHTACQSLRNGECSTALVGGVNILLTPDHHISMSQIQAYAPDGRCKAFDQQANGFVSGEGVGAVLLKPLSQALADNDTIYAVVKGSAVKHNGRTNGMTAPTPRAQAEVIRRAHTAGSVTPSSISYIEAHGTGTSLGDPIEIEGLAQAFGAADERPDTCYIGTVKTNIGHLESAAGIAGLIKVILSMQHYQIPASLHFEEVNPLIHFEDTPFQVNTVLRPWKTAWPRRAGISSFGMGGVNAHVVLEEPPLTPTRRRQVRPAYLLPLSARSEAALEQLVQRYHAHLSTNPDASLADLCYTASTGRAHFKHRLAIIASSTADLRKKLAQIGSGADATALVASGVIRGVASFDAGTGEPVQIAAPVEPSADGWQMYLQAVAYQYVQGQPLDWSQIYSVDAPQRVALPSYPFERERYWFDAPSPEQPQPQPAAQKQPVAPAPHPLLGRRRQ